MTDAEIPARLGAAPDAPVIRLDRPGPCRFWHNCTAQERVEFFPVDQPLGDAPGQARFTCRCVCGAIVVSLPTEPSC